MKERASTPLGNRASTLRGRRASAPLPSRTPESGARPSRAASYGSIDLRKATQRWISDGKAQGWSQRTLNDRSQMMERFCWWLENEEEAPPVLSSVDPTRTRAFLAYVRDPAPNGRWGSDHPRVKEGTRPSTVQTYYRALRAFTNFCVEEGLLEETPLKNVKSPRVPNDQIQPLSHDQVQALLDAARRGRNAERDVAIVLVLVDTGLRVSELCSLKIADADKGSGELTVIGKGNKKRRVYMGAASRRLLWRYIEAARRYAEAEEPLFASVGGTQSSAALTPSGVFQLIQKLGQVGNIIGVRCSPHTLRHTFAVNFLRNGGNLFELQQLMGHSDLTVLRRYVALAEADLERAHRAASPADRMRLK